MSKADWDHLHFLVPKGTKADIERLCVYRAQKGKLVRPGEVSRELFLDALAQALNDEKGAASRRRVTKSSAAEEGAK